MHHLPLKGAENLLVWLGWRDEQGLCRSGGSMQGWALPVSCGRKISRALPGCLGLKSRLWSTGQQQGMTIQGWHSSGAAVWGNPLLRHYFMFGHETNTGNLERLAVFFLIFLISSFFAVVLTHDVLKKARGNLEVSKSFACIEFLGLC